MVRISYKEICQNELGLLAADQKKLKAQARSFQAEWDVQNSLKYPRNSSNIYDDEVLCCIASTYLERGWISRETRVSPGKEFWPNSVVELQITKHSYPRDKVP